MEETKKLGSLEEMTKESLLNRPEQAIEAISEYVNNNLSEDNPGKAEALKKKLENPEYLERFKVAITHTSLMLFLISIKASSEVNVEKGNLTDVEKIIGSIQINIAKYVREFLSFTKDDDKHIYEMRLFYLNELNGQEWAGMEYQDTDVEDTEETKKEKEFINKKIKIYDEILDELKAKYIESKIHLV